MEIFINVNVNYLGEKYEAKKLRHNRKRYPNACKLCLSKGY